MRENQTTKILNHIVTIDNRRKIMLTGVIEVVSSTDKTVITKTQTHSININGEGLRIDKLNLDENILIIEGSINELKYVVKNKSKNIFKRLLK